ncbi:dephospho-CoA kinase [bacterium (candidate division B38) B3_B38]|nr:MAG: dephospho-CoA kinase [bacterium (candidate division B38) B3_B38]
MKVGLTGGIACGRSTVAKMFGERGCYCIDADKIAHRLLQPPSAIWQRVVGYFGEEILNPDQTINRERLGAIVFSDREKRERLNSIVHPQVIEEENRFVEEYLLSGGEEIVIVDAALMIETGSHHRFDKITVVYTDEQTQLERLIERSGLSPEEAQRRIKAQLPLRKKLLYADYKISNSRSLQDTERQVEEVFQSLKEDWRRKFSLLPPR